MSAERKWTGLIVFELTMPHCGSWNGRWSQAERLHVRVKSERDVPKAYWNNEFYYRWDDGWTACVTTRRLKANEARKIERRSDGFCGYDWMIRSICRKGLIEPEER